jgi:hypothetical protein
MAVRTWSTTSATMSGGNGRCAMNRWEKSVSSACKLDSAGSRSPRGGLLDHDRGSRPWITTAVVAAEAAVGGTMDVLRLPPFFTIMKWLGVSDRPLSFAALALISRALRPSERSL